MFIVITIIMFIIATLFLESMYINMMIELCPISAAPWRSDHSSLCGPSFKGFAAKSEANSHVDQIWSELIRYFQMSQMARIKIEKLMKGKKLPFDDDCLETWCRAAPKVGV